MISLLGATPLFVDIDPRTFNLDPASLERAILACRERNRGIHPLPSFAGSASTALEPKGVITVDLFGLPCAYDRINTIAREHGLFVIEDAAQSFGAVYHGKRACALADIGCTSFYPTKPLGAYGEGGAVFTADREIAHRIASIRMHGMGSDQYDNIRIGLNARMHTLQAALLLAKLEIFSSELETRQGVANRYTECLSSHASLQTPHVPEGLGSAWALYSVLSNSRDAIRSALAAERIPTAVYYPKPLHLQTAFAHLGYKDGDFPVAESTAQRIFSLPMHPYLQDREVDRVAAQVRRALGMHGSP
jgi:dTDP-4-amino-4,6-dideoxygalactose transaminase